ncbi:MAG: glycosyltransferase, partial [Gemmatimonadales bacterium]
MGLLISLAALVVAGFFVTLAFAPRLPSLTLKDPQVLQALHVETAHRLTRLTGWRRIPRPGKTAAGGRARPLSVGFYVSWDEDSRTSLRRHINQLDVVAPQWLVLDGSLGRLKVTFDPQADAIFASAKTPPSVLPMVHNWANNASNGPMADALIVYPAARKALIANLVVLAREHGWAGYVFDLENLSPAGLAAYPTLLAEARAALKPLGREVWVSAPFADDSFPLKRFEAVTDTVVLMAYDQHWSGGDPGPPAGQDWFE